MTRRSLVSLLLSFISFGAMADVATAQTTAISAPSGSIQMGGAALSQGVAVFVPVDAYGHPIAVTLSGGGLNLPGSTAKPVGYSCTITSGGISGCSVPDEVTASPSGFRYDVTITDTTTFGHPTSGMSFQLAEVPGITGTSFRLDLYTPTATVPTTAALTFTSGSTAPTGGCAAPALYVDTATVSMYTCVAGGWVISGGGGFPSGASQLVANNNANAPVALPNVTYDGANQQLSVGSASSTPKGLLVMASFGSAAGQQATATVDALLYISVSTDGQHWQLISTGYAGTHTILRDPSITKVGQTYYIAYTSDCPGGTCFSMASSNDLTHWTSMPDVTITGTNPMGGYTWAPEFFISDPGCSGATGTSDRGKACTAAQAVHIFYASATGGVNTDVIYHIKALNSALTSWGNAAGTANSADLIYGPADGVPVLDPFVVERAGEFDLFFVNDYGCTATGTAACSVQYASSTSLASGYTLQTTSDWTGHIGSAYHDAEAPAVYKAGTDASGNEIWRLVFENYNNNTGNGPGLLYLEAHAAPGTAFDAMTWTAASTSGDNYQTFMQPPTGQFFQVLPNAIGTYHHGTVLHLMDVDSLRDVAMGLATEAATWTGCMATSTCNIGGVGFFPPSLEGGFTLLSLNGVDSGNIGLRASTNGSDPNLYVESQGSINFRLGSPNYTAMGAMSTTGLVLPGSIKTGPTATSYDSSATAHFSGTGIHTAELQNTGTANSRTAFTLTGNFGGTYATMFEFGTDLSENGTKDYYIYNYATGKASLDIHPDDSITFPFATEPTGACANTGAWAFSQDGHISFCASGTWVQKL